MHMRYIYGYIAGFDGHFADPLGGDLGLTASDYGYATFKVSSSLPPGIYSDSAHSWSRPCPGPSHLAVVEW